MKNKVTKGINVEEEAETKGRECPKEAGAADEAREERYADDVILGNKTENVKMILRTKMANREQETEANAGEIRDLEEAQGKNMKTVKESRVTKKIDVLGEAGEKLKAEEVRECNLIIKTDVSYKKITEFTSKAMTNCQAQ